MTCLCMHSMRFWILPSDSQYFRNAMATFSSPGAETASTNQVYRFIYIYIPSSKVCAGVCTQLTGSLWISSPCWPKIHNVGNLPPLWLISGKSYKLFSSSSARIWQPFWCWASVQGCIHFENALQFLVLLPFHGDFHLKPRRNWTQVRPMKQRRLPRQLSSPTHPASREKNQAFEQSVESQHCPYPKINVLFHRRTGLHSHRMQTWSLFSHSTIIFSAKSGEKMSLHISSPHITSKYGNESCRELTTWLNDRIRWNIATTNPNRNNKRLQTQWHKPDFSDISKKATVNYGQTCAANPCCCRSRAIKDFSLKMLQIMPYKVKVLAPTSCKCCKWEIQGPQSCKYNAGQQFWCLLDLNFMGVPRSIWKKAGKLSKITGAAWPLWDRAHAVIMQAPMLRPSIHEPNSETLKPIHSTCWTCCIYSANICMLQMQHMQRKEKCASSDSWTWIGEISEKVWYTRGKSTAFREGGWYSEW